MSNEMLRKLPPHLRLQVENAIAEAEAIDRLGDATAKRWLPEQIAYLARQNPEWVSALRPLYLETLNRHG
ncbi:MAG: hypothetical protein N2318_10820 [Meiothermus sp.]|nr:hypothetical protein [Meiothermus sp.]